MKNKQPTKFNYENVDTKGPGPLPIGVYRAKVEKAEFQTAKSGNSMVVLDLSLFEDAEGNTLPKARKVTDRIVVTEDTLFRAVILAEALGISPPADDSEETLKDWCTAIKEAAMEGIWVRTKHESYKAISDETGEEETRQASRIARYLKTNKVADSRTIGGPDASANGEAPKRPRRNGGATAEA